MLGIVEDIKLNWEMLLGKILNRIYYLIIQLNDNIY